MYKLIIVEKRRLTTARVRRNTPSKHSVLRIIFRSDVEFHYHHKKAYRQLLVYRYKWIVSREIPNLKMISQFQLEQLYLSREMYWSWSYGRWSQIWALERLINGDRQRYVRTIAPRIHDGIRHLSIARRQLDRIAPRCSMVVSRIMSHGPSQLSHCPIGEHGWCRFCRFPRARLLVQYWRRYLCAESSKYQLSRLPNHGYGCRNNNLQENGLKS